MSGTRRVVEKKLRAMDPGVGSLVREGRRWKRGGPAGDTLESLFEAHDFN